jgi:hypothetical protein
MRIRDLKRTSGRAVESVWPPSWGGSYGRGDTFPTGDEGTLKGVERTGSGLSLTLDYNGRTHSGSLHWDAPPTLDAVEATLKGQIGKPIKEIGDVEVK